MEEEEEISIKPNVEEVESSSKSLQADDVAPVLDDSSLVEPGTVVTESVVAEIVGEPTAVVMEADVKMEVEEVGGMGSFELGPVDVGERETDTTEMVAEGQEGVLEGTVEGVLEDFEAATESIIEVKEEINIVEMGKEKEVETEMEREVDAVMGGEEGFAAELEPKAEGGGEEFVSDVDSKEEQGNGAEVMEEVLTVEPKMESEIVDRGEPGVDSMAEPVGDSMAIDAVNDENEATEEDNDEIKATQDVVEDEVKVVEEVEKDETEAIAEVEKGETEAVEKDEAVAMEEVEEDESGPMEEVEKDYGEGESTGAEDELEIAGIEKDGGKGESIAAEDENDDEATPTEEDVPEVEAETPDSGKSAAGKRKRGKNLKVSTKTRATRKTIEEEDVCFICFDGGDLVLCDRRGCPKAYHPSCVNRDEAFFQAKGRWNCGWHLCSLCQKDAYVMCYTCTFSCCKSCLKDAGMLCVKKTRGFCETCMKTVMLIEKNEMGNKEEPVDFDDKSSWEYLFKDYWIGLKERLSLSLNDIVQDKNARKGSELADKQESPSEQYDEKDNAGSSSDNSAENFEASKKKRRKAKKRVKSVPKKVASSTAAVGEGNSKPENTDWATEELLEFVMHMKNGDRSVVSQYDVQSLLLDYIQINNLRDPKRKSQIICDFRLENLFGKRRVGHFEMLKLLESHFLIKEDAQIDDGQGTVVDTEASRMDDDETPEAQTKGSKGRKRKARKKGDGRGPQYNREEYAAIDIHNISLIYLRRKLVEDLLEDTEKFEEKVVGTFVRIRIVGTNQKQDLYRLVQVVGTSKATEPYKIGKRTADIMLEILNLNKTEIISIDTISNQEFTEDECKRLRQSIKCGLINRRTVGDILDKAMEVQEARVDDWLETEIVRLSHLRDRASDMGHRKELRESVEKLQILKTTEERTRRLEEVPTINADPKMDPSYESEDDSEKEETKQEIYTRPRGGSSFNRRGSDPVSPRSGDFYSKDSWGGTVKNLSKNYEVSRSLSNKGFSTNASPSYETRNDNSWNQGSDKIHQQAKIFEKSSSVTDTDSRPSNLSPVIPETDISISEADKMWHYKDPAGKIQGPFSLVQLRKWSNNGYFPADLKTWRVTDKEDDGILLTDALAGNFASLKQRREGQGTPSGHQNTPLVPKLSNDGRNDSMNLPSPTPQQSTPGWARGETAPYRGGSSFPSGDGGLQSPTPDSTLQTRSSTPSSIGASGTPMPTSHDSSNSHSTFVGSANMLQTSQSGHLVPAPDNSQMAAHMGQPISGQNSIVAQGWGGAPTQNLQPNPSMNVAGQMVAYNQWTGVPSMVQNSTGTLPQQPDPWGQAAPVPSNQPNMQQQQQPQPLPNVNWGAMQGNPNMGWVGNPNMNWGTMIPGPVGPGNVNPTTWVMPPGGQVQGPMPGNMNGGWVAAPVGPTPGVNVQGMPSNQGWVGAPPSSNPGAQMQGIPPNNQGWVATPGWGTQTGNQVSPAQGQPPTPGNVNQGWGPQTGNQGGGTATGNPNQGWGPPAAAAGGGNQGWSNEKQRNGDGFSGQRGGSRGPQSGDRRPYNRDNRGSRDRNRDRDGDRRSSYGSRGGGPRDDSSKSNEPIVCPYYPKGRCNMGPNCRFLHK